MPSLTECVLDFQNKCIVEYSLTRPMTMHNWVMEWILVIDGLLIDTTCLTCTLHTCGIAQKLNTDWFLILDIYSMTSGTCESAFVTRSFRHWTACTEFSDDLKFSNLSPYLLQTCAVEIQYIYWVMIKSSLSQQALLGDSLFLCINWHKKTRMPDTYDYFYAYKNMLSRVFITASIEIVGIFH